MKKTINLIFKFSLYLICIIINYSAYAIGELSIIKYFEQYPHNHLNCEINNNPYLYIFKEKFVCSIYFDNSTYIIKLDSDGNSKFIKLKNIGSMQMPIFKIIQQDEFESPYYSGLKKLFDDKNKVVVGRYGLEISIELAYVKELSAFINYYFFEKILILFNHNPQLEHLEDMYTIHCYGEQNLSKFKKNLLATGHARIANSEEIDEIYEKSLQQFSWDKICLGCSLKAYLLFDKIHEFFPSKTHPVLIIAKGSKIGFYYGDTLNEWSIHYVLAYISNSENEIYILDPFFSNHIIKLNEWVKKFNFGHDLILESCIFNVY